MEDIISIGNTLTRIELKEMSVSPAAFEAAQSRYERRKIQSVISNEQSELNAYNVFRQAIADLYVFSL